MRRKIVRTIASLAALFILSSPFSYWYMLGMPGRSHSGPLPLLVDDERDLATRLRRHVTAIAQRPHNTSHPIELEACARAIEATLREMGYEPRAQVYRTDNIDVRNIEVVIEPAREVAGGQKPIGTLVIGAHYDSFGVAPGANDNGSGVAALIELARLLKSHPMTRTRLRLVFFVNEEPPHFQTATMGSLVYARALAATGEKVRAMVSLETLGAYSDVPGSQTYPVPLPFVLPHTADFVAIVGSASARPFVADFTRRFRSAVAFPSIGIVAPAILDVVDWSDHWSFGKFNIPSAMITDTALFRYRHYHLPSDTPDKLDYDRLARVTAGLGRVIRSMAD